MALGDKTAEIDRLCKGFVIFGGRGLQVVGGFST
jgi:hypothetical protein